MKSTLLSLLLTLGLGASLSARLHAQVRDLASDYSAADNPAGAWAYGCRTTPAGTNLSFLPDPHTEANLNGWHLSAFPHIGKAFASGGPFWLPPDTFTPLDGTELFEYPEINSRTQTFYWMTRERKATGSGLNKESQNSDCLSMACPTE